MLQQMLRAARLDRRVYTELIFDDYATGNAILAVAGVYAVIALVAGLHPWNQPDQRTSRRVWRCHRLAGDRRRAVAGEREAARW
ncbi:MAG: hypothetical protein GWP04_08570 [Gammaproteobacteria bacterium]|nr:hypothetical protein [Gammaproteobacteria bacterium]